MADWNDVGDWLKANGSAAVGLVGSLLTGNVPGAVAAGISLVGGATGTTDATKALQALRTDPQTAIRLQELANSEQASIREHVRLMEEARLKDSQAEQKEQQDTIRGGDQAQDEYVRRTRPMIVRQAWYATLGYTLGTEVWNRIDPAVAGADWQITMVLMTPVLAYFGFRTGDKFAQMLGLRRGANVGK